MVLNEDQVLNEYSKLFFITFMVEYNIDGHRKIELHSKKIKKIKMCSTTNLYLYNLTIIIESPCSNVKDNTIKVSFFQKLLFHIY